MDDYKDMIFPDKPHKWNNMVVGVGKAADVLTRSFH